MKAFLKRFKKNNKGMSLVELVCAVAIFGMTTTVIGGAMIVSSQSYQRGTVELDVQKEAQTTTNLIGNLIIDSNFAEFNDGTDTLVLKSEGVTNTISFSGNTISYVKEATDSLGNPITMNGTLAENVTQFHVDLSNFTTDKNVKVELKVEEGGRTYEADYNTTSRNGAAEQQGAEKVANIYMDTEVVLEPGQTYYIPYYVLGISTGVEIKNQVGTYAGTSVSVDGDKIKIVVADGAMGLLNFDVCTTATQEGTTTPLDTQTVDVKIRRVNEVVYSTTSDTEIINSETACKQNAIYRIYADAAGSYLDKAIGKAYDTDYVSPRPLSFSYTMTGITGNVSDYIGNVKKVEDAEKPYIEFQLLQDMPNNSTITITAVSKHADGANKASRDYTGTGCVSKNYVIEKLNNGNYDLETAFRRGDEQVWFKFNNATLATQMNSEANGWANNFVRYFRFYKTSETPGTDDLWMLAPTTGDQDIKLLTEHTHLMDPEEEYYIELKVEIRRTNLNRDNRDRNGDGVVNDMDNDWNGDGVITDADYIAYPTSSMDWNDYVSKYKVSAASIKSKFVATNSAYTYDADDEYESSYGTFGSPKSLNLGEVIKIGVETHAINLKRGIPEGKLIPKVYVYDTSYPTNWREVTDSFYYETFGSYDAEDNQDEGYFNVKPKSSVGTGDIYRMVFVYNHPEYNYDPTTKQAVATGNSTEISLTNGEDGVYYFTYN